jgi:hypothetical protein
MVLDRGDRVAGAQLDGTEGGTVARSTLVTEGACANNQDAVDDGGERERERDRNIVTWLVGLLVAVEAGAQPPTGAPSLIVPNHDNNNNSKEGKKRVMKEMKKRNLRRTSSRE